MLKNFKLKFSNNFNLDRHFSISKFQRINSTFFCEQINKFSVKSDDENLTEEELTFLKELNLECNSESDKIKTIKKLISENILLKKSLQRANYRIDHLLDSINTIEKNLK